MTRVKISDNSTEAVLASKSMKRPIQGPGLTAPGIVILQSLFILLIETAEYAIGKIGTITGVAIVAAVAGGIYLGRAGPECVIAVTAPLAALFSTILVLCTLGGVGLHLARLGLDLVTSLAALAPYLAISAIVGWAHYLYRLRFTRS